MSWQDSAIPFAALLVSIGALVAAIATNKQSTKQRYIEALKADNKNLQQELRGCQEDNERLQREKLALMERLIQRE